MRRVVETVVGRDDRGRPKETMIRLDVGSVRTEIQKAELGSGAV